MQIPAFKISRGNREIALYFPRDAGREAGNEITNEIIIFTRLQPTYIVLPMQPKMSFFGNILSQ